MSDDAAAYATALLRQVERILRVTPAADLHDACASLDGFVAAPRAATYVAATRALARARRAHTTQHLRAFHDDRIFRRGLEAVRAVPGLDPGQAEALAALAPVDARTGQRLLALAQLLEVHAELAGRAQAAFREIRRKLAAASVPPRPRPYQ